MKNIKLITVCTIFPLLKKVNYFFVTAGLGYIWRQGVLKFANLYVKLQAERKTFLNLQALTQIPFQVTG
jgi:hypothetical protein